ncbi:sugar phosphate isomerase/epimerase family protein [Chengkuizengella sediminis]|uniref:sugar phosphate isomerase/epimerase family protein n=1 Tax=Chengkuizengella sediminis TaxID=1885917 RepID=UPI0013898CB1|nr:sugar phosphate isomerase/epimerase [Chengkuizengella sediminis]NDI36554.1 sugar phosphate isomerase/epimerase [Chengkuizengella sediminis]
MSIPVGLQLYTLREETEKDFVGTLKAVADMGYQAVEFAGYGGIEAKEMKKVLNDLGLSAPSSHVPIELLLTQLEEQIQYSVEIEAKYIVCPYLDAGTYLRGEQNLKNTLINFQKIALKCKENGLQFAYHNHDFEFEKSVDGKYILDHIYQSVEADLLVAELDLFWVKKAGLDPIQYLSSLKNRCPIIHVKDMTNDNRKTFAEVGHGIIDYPSIFEMAEQMGIKYYIVEQDVCERSPLESVKMSIDYLKSIGIA